MPPAKEVEPPPLLPREETTVESAATLEGTEGVDEVEARNPVSASEEGPSLEQRQSQAHPPSERAHLDELSAPPPAKDGDFSRRSADLEGAREESHRGSKRRTSPAGATKTLLPTFYMHSYLVFFSMLGTLARLGLQAITIYPGAPVALGEIWANVAGTLVMGYLAEDRVLFQRDLAPATQRMQKRHDGSSSSSSSSPSSSSNNNNDAEHAAQLKKEHMTIKKSIPAYIGLTVGFCGSLTTFSSFMRDAFLALSNDLNTAPMSSTETLSSPARSRNAGYSVEALLAVLILEVAAGLASLSFGAHAALYSERIIVARPVIPKKKNEKKKTTTTTTTRSVLDPLVAVLAWPMWLGAVLMGIWAPHGHGAWRGQAVFALVFAPAGCVARYRLSAWLNGRVPRFPLGTFAANVCGTVVLGMCYDLQHTGGGRGVVGCQVLQGVMDGFCGCLTTVSTWVLELKTLRRGHAQLGIATPRPPNTVRNTPSQHSPARVQRRRLPRPSPNLDGIDTRLERLETLLERVIHASSSRPPTVEERQSSSHVSLRATPEQPSPATPSAEPIRAEKDDDGTLLVAKGGSQFVSSHHWSLLATELQDIREILSTDKEPSTPDVFAVPTGHVTQFLPADVPACYDLLRIFYLYVDPITRLVHKPTLDKRFALFIQEYVNPRWLATNGSEEHLEEKLNHDGLLQFRPLAFAIFYAAAHSQAVASGYAEDKRRLTATYRKGLELSLLAADFCSSSSLEVLQAYKLCLMTSRSMEWKCWLTFWCGVPKDFRKKVMSDEARRKVLHESVSLLENLNAITADPGVQGFKWFLEAHSAFQCIFLVLSELRELRERSELRSASLPNDDEDGDGDEDGALRGRAVAALRQIVALHDQGAESRPWAVVGKYVERLDRPRPGVVGVGVGVETGGVGGRSAAGDGGGDGGSPMDDVRRHAGAAPAPLTVNTAAAAIDSSQAVADQQGGFDPFGTPSLPQPFATEEELLQFTFPPGTEWADPMQDFGLWHMQ
ncbi:hypothetical protein SLS55_005045 [Diplodia seriata]|uniref:C6 transcription factor n=1 Tax=Diplodia seriata TaxID=420778 RepID=A0ABR3CFK5_9PEZI